MSRRVLYYDVLNVLACLAVISLHHNNIVHTYSDSLMWKTALIPEAVCYWAVPVFLMLSGATLMNYRAKYDTATFFRRRLSRALIPFLAWSALVLVWKVCVIGSYTLSPVSVRTVLDAIINNRVESRYWFFPLLIACYLMMPVFSWLTGKRCRSTLWYLVLAMFLFQGVITPLCKVVGLSWNSTLAPPLHRYFIYIPLGYLLSTTSFTAVERRLIYLVGLGGTAFRYVAVYLLCTADGAKNDIFFDYAAFPAVLQAVAVFVWAKSVDWARVLRALRLTPERLAKLSSCSLGIYLIHSVVMRYELQLLAPLGITERRVIWRTALIAMTYLVSLGAVSLLKRVPGLRRLVP